jgi:hypothetical protein
MLTPNTLIHDRYLIARQVSGEGASAVYETIDIQTRAPIVLMQVLVSDGDDEGLPRHAEVEQAVQVLAGLRHPNLPVVRDSFVESESIFLAMELVPGEDLATILERDGKPFPVGQVLRWADQLLDALDYIHTLQPPLIHGDIRPQNLKLKPGDQIVLLGFGLARGAPLAEQAVSSGGTSQPVSFALPEQAQSAPADEHGDLFALAATLYYLLTSVLPVPATERAAAVAQGRSDPLTPLHMLNPLVPTAVNATLVQALALDPSQRPASAAALRAALEQPQEYVQPPSPSEQRRDTVVLPETTPAPSRRRGLVFAIAGAAALLFLLAILALRGSIFGDPAIAQQPTPQLPASSLAVVTTVPPTTTVETPTAAAPAVTARPPDPTATLQPAPQVSSVEPQTAFVGTLPLVLTLRGAALDQVHTARLIADGRTPIAATLQPDGASQLTLSVAALPEPLDGEVQYRLELDSVRLEAPTISLRDFVQRKVVQGVLARYTYTRRVASDATGPYTRMRADPNVDSRPAGPLRNDDGIEVLRDDVEGWYQVRVRSSGDPAQVHTTGWVERWLVDNQDMPAKPTPLAFAGRVYSAPTDAAVQCGTAFDSSIYGSVEDTNGRGISGARVRITSADGHNSYTVTTGRGGIYSVPGLGCTTWTVRLVSVPNAPNGIQANPVTVRNLNGGRFTSAEVRFKQQNGP